MNRGSLAPRRWRHGAARGLTLEESKGAAMRAPSWSALPALTTTMSGDTQPTASAARAGTKPPSTVSRTLTPPGPLGSGWTRIAKIGYGTASALLGTSAGGDAGSIQWGPSYGTQVPDKTWWYADSAKRRLAHFSDSGTYLGRVTIPASCLSQGVDFQWQNPQALADGTVVLTSTTIDSPGLLLLSPTSQLRTVALDRFVSVVISDGHRLYGFDENQEKVQIAPRTGTITTVPTFAGQTGDTFNITVAPSYLTVTRPDVSVRINLAASGFEGAIVHPGVEAAVGTDGKLWLLITGMVELDPDHTPLVLGILNVTTTGVVSPVSPVRRPTSESDPADGHHLGIRYGGRHPWLMFIDTDAVRVYRRK